MVYRYKFIFIKSNCQKKVKVMIIVLKQHASSESIRNVVESVKKLGYEPKEIKGVEHTVIACIGDELSNQTLEALKNFPDVQSILPIQKKYKLASREYSKEDSVVKIGKSLIGGGNFQIIAGPCAIESYEQMQQTVKDVVSTGVTIIRGGAYKPRTSPYAFQGLREEGLEILTSIKKEFGVAVVTEVVGTSHIEKIAEVADCLQIGARNCQNYNLLEAVAKVGKPVLLKRGMAMTVYEWLSSAEYLLANTCPSIIFCERGIRTFETVTRGTLDLGGVAVVKQETHFPVIVDPSHAAGKVSLVLPLSKASIALGVDGLIVETHPNPMEASSDPGQQIESSKFYDYINSLTPLINICCKK